MILIRAVQDDPSFVSRGQLLELATGEGKTVVIATFAAIKCLMDGGRKLDIACSSSILARRDQEECRQFHEYWGLTSDHIQDYGERKG